MFRRILATVVISGTALGGMALAGPAVAQAGARVPTSLSIKAPHRVTYGQSATVTGKLTSTRTHKALSGKTVLLQDRRPGTTKWITVATETTAPDGTVSGSFTPARAEQVRWLHPRDASTWRSTSTVRLINVAYAVDATQNGGTVSVTVAPHAAHQRVKLQIHHGRWWRTVHVYRLDANSSVTFTIKPPNAKGTYHYRVVKPAAHGYLRGVSATLTVTVS